MQSSNCMATPTQKLPASAILAIRSAYRQGSTTSELARKWQLARSTIQNIVDYRTYQEVS